MSLNLQKWSPHPYQVKAVNFLINNYSAALFLDPGLGKTSITLQAIKFLKEHGALNKVLLIAPLRICYSVWPAEIAKWSNFSDLKISVVHGPGKQAALEADADIYILNPEGLAWLLDARRRRLFLEKKFDVLIIDELTKFKHTNTSRFKKLKPFLPLFRRRWGLTGSPASNGLMDLFGQCYVLDLGESLGKYITHYRNEYFTQDYNGFTWTLKPNAESMIFERIRPLALRMGAEDYLKMPELITNNIRIELPENARKIYDDLEKELIAQIEGSMVTASNVGVATLKCRQIANGGVYNVAEGTSTREIIQIHDAKTDALEELVDELQGQPLLVAYEFEHDLQRIFKRFGKLPYIGGGVSAARSAELEKQWNAGKIPILLGHPASIGHGLNLQQVGRHICWFSLTWNFELYDQFNRRIYRQGNNSKVVTIHHLVAKHTIDEIVYNTLKYKKRNQEALFHALLEFSKSKK